MAGLACLLFHQSCIVPELPDQRPAAPTNPDPQVTRALEAVARDEPGAASRLLELLYSELRQLAQARLAAAAPGNTLQATALVHEAYLRLVGESAQGEQVFQGKSHFFAAAARAMRNILVDQARRKKAVKHGGDRQRAHPQTLDQLPDLSEARTDLADLDDALKLLEAKHPRKAEVVMLRYFAGLTMEQIAQVLAVTTRTVDREWLFAKAWLQREMEARLNGRPGSGDAPHE